MTLEEMVDNKHTAKLRWSEPWTATDHQGNEFTAAVELHATVSDCIGMSRAYAKRHGHPTDGPEIAYLADFIATHWAHPVNPTT